MKHQAMLIKSTTVRAEISAVCKFADFVVTYKYSKNLIIENLLV